MRISHGLSALVLLCSAGLTQAAECSALQAEVQTLRARVQALEAAIAAGSQESAASPATQAALPGTADKPAPKATVVVEEPYSRTGCRAGLFEGIKPAKWQESNVWFDLEKGQTPAAVEALLGVEHYDEAGGGNVIWHYGKCGKRSMAQVLFSQGKLADWRAPKH